MRILSNLKEYEVHIESDFDFLSEMKVAPDTQYVVDKNVFEIYRERFPFANDKKLIIIDALEENKTIQTALDICERMTDLSAKRNACLVSIGGGIIQDITGFVASILYRGIHWTFVPTTLLAACDSCIGSKTSLNYKGFKNLLGTFYPPDDIYICAEFFQTLTEHDFRSGLGEVTKFNIMSGDANFAEIENDIGTLLMRDKGKIAKYLEKSLSYKKGFIEQDEFDRGERIKLNFAHTFGHAIEVVTEYKIPHGTAVAIGMIMANYVSVNRGMIPERFADRAEALLLKVIEIDPALIDVPMDAVLAAMHKDKKQTSEQLTAVLLSKDGLMIIHDLQSAEVDGAFEHFNSLLKQAH